MHQVIQVIDKGFFLEGYEDELWVDVDGNPVENDFSDQADMCEIIRAMLANSKLYLYLFYF